MRMPLRTIRIAAIVLAAVSLLLWNDIPIAVRFVNPAFNFWYVPLASTLVILAVGVNLRWQLKPSVLAANSALLIIVSLPFMLISFFAHLAVSDVTKYGYDPSFEPIQTVSTQSGDYRLYRTNGGATTAFGIVVRKERQILQGLLLVREVYSEYMVYEARLVQTQNGLQLLVEEYGSQKPGHIVEITKDA